MNQLPSILTPDLGLLIWMLAAFLVVFFVLAKYALPVIVEAVEKRSNHINDSLKKAEEAAVKLANIQKEGESILQQARQQQAQILKLQRLQSQPYKHFSTALYQQLQSLLCQQPSRSLLTVAIQQYHN